jgi:serine/threonine protein phosphatase PrpC
VIPPWPPDTLKAVLGFASLLGDRDEQQDRYRVSYKDGRLLLMLADGMGGHSGGARAAEIMAGTAEKLFLEKTAAEPEALFADIFSQAWESMRQTEQTSGLELRTTAVMIILEHQGQAWWAHAGDSRLYFIGEDGNLRNRTRDHTIAALAIENGELTEAEALHHPDRSVLYNCVGGPKPPKPVFGRADPPLADGSLVLVCSDGFWEFFPPEEVPAGPNLQDVVRQSAEEAVRRAEGRADNTTLVAFRYRQDMFPAVPRRFGFWKIFKRP